MGKKSKVIVITGVPGTGKTSIAAELASLAGAKVLSINELVVAQGLFGETDITDGAKIVLLPKLQAAVKKEIAGRNGSIIVEGHLACELNMRADVVFVCRCHPDILRKRLAARGYKEEKTKANVLSEMLDYCTLQCERGFPKANIFEIDTSSKNAHECAAYALGVLEDKKAAAKSRQKVDWAGLLFAQEVQFRNFG